MAMVGSVCVCVVPGVWLQMVAAWLVLSGASAGGFALSFVFSQWFLHAGDSLAHPGVC